MRKALIVLCLTVVAGPALAHEGDHGQMAALAGLRHLLTQPDHLLALAGLITLATAGGIAWRRRLRRSSARAARSASGG